MDLTARYVQDSRQTIAQTEAADITNPDLTHQTAVTLMVRLTETLRTMSDHAGRQQTVVDELRTENQHLETEAKRLRAELQQLRNAADRTP